MYLSKHDAMEILRNSDYSNIELNISYNKYKFLTNNHVLYLHYFKYNLLKRDWNLLDIASESYHRLKKVQNDLKKNKKTMTNLNVCVDYDLLLKEDKAESYYIFRQAGNIKQ